MGIKFLCPNGHKLHVKAFLSGKRAICPRCGARVVVPSVDAVDASGQSSANPPAPGEQSIEIALDQPLGMATKATEAPLQPSATPAQSSIVPPPAAAPAHPLDESPGAVWYVRPASGGQFGPASAEIMRNWLSEGRVGANALVWRAGWSEWRNAAAAFPELGQPTASIPTATNGLPPLPVGHVVQTVAAEPAAPVAEEPDVAPLAQSVRKRRRKRDVRLIASAILAVVSLILVIVLVLVSRPLDDGGGPANEESPAASEEDLI